MKNKNHTVNSTDAHKALNKTQHPKTQQSGNTEDTPQYTKDHHGHDHHGD